MSENKSESESESESERESVWVMWSNWPRATAWAREQLSVKLTVTSRTTCQALLSAFSDSTVFFKRILQVTPFRCSHATLHSSSLLICQRQSLWLGLARDLLPFALFGKSCQYVTFCFIWCHYMSVPAVLFLVQAALASLTSLASHPPRTHLVHL